MWTIKSRDGYLKITVKPAAEGWAMEMSIDNQTFTFETLQGYGSITAEDRAKWHARQLQTAIQKFVDHVKQEK